jgi:5-carboxymethyl-2-hydroxymuconate isomerase
MPPLRYDYPPALAARADPAAFAEAMRAAMAATGLFPVGGIRVRGHAADAAAAFDGREGWLWLDMDLRIGAGRSGADKGRACDALYAAARAFLEPRIAPRPFALSLAMREIDPVFSRKGWNTVHAALGD